jgi:hypothetical protein
MTVHRQDEASGEGHRGTSSSMEREMLICGQGQTPGSLLRLDRCRAFGPKIIPGQILFYSNHIDRSTTGHSMSYLQQKDSTWQTRRLSSPFTRYTRLHRRQLFVLFALLCMLVYWTVCVGINSHQNLYTPPLPASPNFFAGGSEDRLVTVQPHKGLFIPGVGNHDGMSPSSGPVRVSEGVKSVVLDEDRIAEEQTSESPTAAVQVIKGSSIYDIGDIEEQQSSTEDALELQPVVADGGRLTESSKAQAVDRLESQETSALNRGIRLEGLTRPLPATSANQFEAESQLVKPVTSISTYVFPDTSNFERLNRLADELPDFVHIPLYMAVGDEVLEGWEEDWFAHAEYNPTKHGRIREPKIYFVYTCKFLIPMRVCTTQADVRRG